MKFLWIFRHAWLRLSRWASFRDSAKRIEKFNKSVTGAEGLSKAMESFVFPDFLGETYNLNPAQSEMVTKSILFDHTQIEFDPNPFFDTDYYSSTYSASLSNSPKTPLAFYISEGARMGHLPSPTYGTFLAHETLGRYQSSSTNQLEQIFKDLFVGKTGIQGTPLRPPESSTVVYQGLDYSKIAILVPVYNNWMWTERCLRALKKCIGVNEAAVYVVDDFSSDKTLDYLSSRFPWVRVIKNAENLGFLKSCNRAFELVREQHEFVLLLNNDTEPFPQFLAELLRTLVSNSDVALAGSKLIYPDGLVQEAGGIVWKDGTGWNFGRNKEDNLELITSRSVDYVSFASVLIRVSSIIGPLFDEEFFPAYYEDTDLAFRMRSQGAVVQFVPYSIVVHHEGKSHGTDISKGVKKHQLKNQSKFAKKWSNVLSSHHLPDPMRVLQAALRQEVQNSRGVVLWIDYQLPDPTQDSGSVRTVEIAKLLKELGYLVIFVPQNEDFVLKNPYWLAREGVILKRSLSSAYSLLLSLGLDPDHVMLSRVNVAKDFYSKIRDIFPSANIVFDTVDLHFLRLERQALVAGSASLKSVASQLKGIELDLIDKCDKTLVVSDAEYALLRTIKPSADIHVVSNVHHAAMNLNKPADTQGLVFVGSFNHPPNEEGIRWFLDRVWVKLPPKVRSEGLKIVGPNLPAWLRNFRDPDVKAMGWVESSTDVVLASRVSIAPLLSGAGVKGKVGEAMAALTPVVGTTIATEGMGLVNGKSCLIADSSDDFAHAITYLFLNRKSAEELAAEAFQVINAKFTPEVAKLALARSLNIDGN